MNRPRRVWDPTRRDGPAALFNYEDIPTYIAEFPKTQALEGTNTSASYVGNRWDEKKPFELERGMNEWDNLEEQLKQPWEYYKNHLDDAPPAEYQDPVYRQTASNLGIAYKQWAFVHNVALHLYPCKEYIREETYSKYDLAILRTGILLIPPKEIFRTMDKDNHEGGKPTSKNLGVLIKNETNRIIKDNQNPTHVDMRN